MMCDCVRTYAKAFSKKLRSTDGSAGYSREHANTFYWPVECNVAHGVWKYLTHGVRSE